MIDCKPCQLREHCTKAPRRAISVRVKEHHQALQEARARQKGAEFREKYRSRSGIEGTISKAGSRLWSPSQSLSWHGENTFAALDYCDSYQLGTCLGVGGPNAFGEDAHFSLWCFSFGGLSPQVRQQDHFVQEPLFVGKTKSYWTNNSNRNYSGEARCSVAPGRIMRYCCFCDA